MSSAQADKDSIQVIQLLNEVNRLSHHCSPYSVEESKPKKHKSKARAAVADNVLYEYAEHDYLGDRLNLKGHSGPLTLSNGIKLSYGQINGLSGDLFASDEPICLGTSQEDCERRFMKAFDNLLTGGGAAEHLIGKLQAEVDSFKDAAKNPKDYSKSFETTSWWKIALDPMLWGGKNPGYLRLGAINLDHFGDDARIAYNTGHRLAMKKAASAKNRSESERENILAMAYIMNGFADHFLEDRFSSGHLRTPRRKLFDGLNSSTFPAEAQAKSLCAKAMHDEDNKRGLNVQSPDKPGFEWKVYGDGHLLSEGNEYAVSQCLKSLEASVDEVYQAWSTGDVPADNVFGAWKYAPTLESASGPANFPPLFDARGWVRTPRFGSDSVEYKPVDDKAYEPLSRDLTQGPAQVGTDSSNLTAFAKVEGSAWESEGDYNGKHEFVGAKAGVTVGGYTGADASIHAWKMENDNAKLKIGLGIDTGAGYKDQSIQASVLGFGLSLGRETGFKLLGSEIKLKLW